MGRAGFEPANSERTVLQTVCVDRLHIYPGWACRIGRTTSSCFLKPFSSDVQKQAQEPSTRLELVTSPLPRECSTAELRGQPSATTEEATSCDSCCLGEEERTTPDFVKGHLLSKETIGGGQLIAPAKFDKLSFQPIHRNKAKENPHNAGGGASHFLGH